MSKVHGAGEGCFLRTLNTGCVIIAAIVGVPIAIAFLLMMFDGADDVVSPGETVEASSSDPAEASSGEPIEAAFDRSQCIDVSEETLATIAKGLEVAGGGSLRNGWAVRSGAHEHGYFVSAQIVGEGLTDSAVGTWFMDRVGIERQPYMVGTISHMAAEFSDWGSFRHFASMSDPGANESRRCMQ